MSPFDERHKQAVDLLIQGNLAGAVARYEAYLVAVPADPAAWLELGMAYSALARHSDAVVALTRAVDLAPVDVNRRLALSQALAQVGKLDGAFVQLVEAERLTPMDTRVCKEMGILYYQQRRYDLAVKTLERRVATHPEDARAHYALGLAHEARHDMGAAVVSYRAAVKADARFTAAHRTLADALASLGEHEEAIAVLGVVLQVDPTDAQVAKNREILMRALAEMRQRRLLGKGRAALEASELFAAGGLRPKGAAASNGTALTQRYAAPLIELSATFTDQAITSLFLGFTDPDRAARAEDDTFKVTVIARDGGRTPVNFAVAATLTFLREALGCPMTQTSVLYGQLLSARDVNAAVTWSGAELTFDSILHPDRPTDRWHGIKVSLVSGPSGLC